MKCPCGKEVPRKTATCNVAEIEKETGLRHIARSDGYTVWLCPDCFQRARTLMIEMTKIMGCIDFYAPCLVRTLHLPDCPGSFCECSDCRLAQILDGRYEQAIKDGRLT